jgi:hypothetical protein
MVAVAGRKAANHNPRRHTKDVQRRTPNPAGHPFLSDPGS